MWLYGNTYDFPSHYISVFQDGKLFPFPTGTTSYHISNGSISKNVAEVRYT